MRRYLLCLLFLLAIQAPAQDLTPGPDGYTVRPGFGWKKAVATGIVGSVFVANSLDFYYSWWVNTEKPFSFFTDHWLNGAQRGLDKVGHMFGTHAIFKSMRNTLLWGGYDRTTALWVAAGMAAFNSVEIEVGDGFSPYGFDYQDLAFGFAGIALGMLQSEIPALDNFRLKFSYFTNQGLKTPAAFIEDYDALTIWCSVNVHNLLPAPARKYWPEFINLAVGFGVTDGVTKREFVFGLDLNLEAFHIGNEDVLYAQKILDLMHIPAPGFVWTEGKKPVAKGIYVK
jgi:hypothetical protein